MEINGKEIRINRDNVKISDMDVSYCELVKEILEKGVETKNRTGINTISIAGWYHKFDLSKEFPIAETKKVVVKNSTSEIQWIHQVQSNEVSWLKERDNHTWDLWEVDEDGIYRIYEQGADALDEPDKKVIVKDIYGKEVLDKYGKPLLASSTKTFKDNSGNEKKATIKSAIYYGKEYKGTIGEAYGYINSIYQRPQYVENTIKNNPSDRRMLISLWQDNHLQKAVLPSCVWSVEFKVTPDGKLHSFVHQRSADVPLGLPFNITQYAIMLSMMAKANGLEPGTMSYSIMDAHIYKNQLKGIKKQLQRYKYMQEYVSIIHNSNDTEIDSLYKNIIEEYNNNYIKASILLGENINLPMSKQIAKLETLSKDLAKVYEESYERKVCYEHLLTRETPELELAKKDSFFEYSTNYAKKGDKYLLENPIGNKDIILKKYTPTPFIGMPIAQ